MTSDVHVCLIAYNLWKRLFAPQGGGLGAADQLFAPQRGGGGDKRSSYAIRPAAGRVKVK